MKRKLFDETTLALQILGQAPDKALHPFMQGVNTPRRLSWAQQTMQADSDATLQAVEGDKTLVRS